MGLTQRLGTIPLAIQTDSSNNVGIGGAANASYKLAVTGASLFSSSVQIQSSNGIKLNRSANDYYWQINSDSSNYLNFGAYLANGTAYGTNPKMILLDNGNVGIGTNSPNAPLNVVKDDGVSSGLHILADFNRNTSSAELILGYYGDGTNVTTNAIYSANSLPLAFYTGATERMRITSSGKVLINTTTTTSQNEMFTVRGEAAITYLTDVTRYRQLYYSGNDNFYFYNGTNNAYLSSAGAWTNASDVTIKKDIQDLQYGLNEVLLLKPRIYKMKSNDLIQVGFIAQEVEEVIPELVDEDDKGMKGLSYGQLTSVLTKALQESYQIIKDLEARIVTLESKIN